MAQPLTAPAVRARKTRTGAEPLVMVTAYDAPGARIADEAGVDLILVGDSVAMVVLGYDDTLQVTVEDMAHHVAAVARARPRPLVVGDLPWLSYHLSVDDSVRNIAKSGEAAKLYDKWFMQPIPPANTKVGLPASDATKAAWANPTDKPLEEYAQP